MRERTIGRGETTIVVAGGDAHARGHQHMFADIVFPCLTRHLLDHLSGDHVENIVVGVAAAEAGRRLDVAQALDGFGTRQAAARHEQQIARAEPESAAMDQQIANGHLARHPRVVHLETRQAIDHLVVPADLPCIDERSERRGSHRLARGSGWKDRVGIDTRCHILSEHAIAARQRRLTVLDDGHRHARHADARTQTFHTRIEVRGRRRECRNRPQAQHQNSERPHEISFRRRARE